MLPFYYASVQSILSYSVSVWGQSVDWERAFILQKRIIRLMFSLPYRTSCREYFVREKILTLASIYILNTLTYVHRNRDRYLSHSDIHYYNTRNASRIYLDREKHAFQRRAPVNSGCRLYNLLPPGLVALPAAAFGRHLKRLLTDGAFYTVDEFIDHLRTLSRH